MFRLKPGSLPRHDSGAVDGFYGIAKHDTAAALSHDGLDNRGTVTVELKGEKAVRRFDDSRLRTHFQHGVSGFEAEKAAAYHHDTPGREKTPVRRAGIVECPDREHVVAVGSPGGWNDGPRSGGEDETVEGKHPA